MQALASAMAQGKTLNMRMLNLVSGWGPCDNENYTWWEEIGGGWGKDWRRDVAFGHSFAFCVRTCFQEKDCTQRERGSEEAKGSFRGV